MALSHKKSIFPMEGKNNYVKLICILIPRVTSILRTKFLQNWHNSNPKWKNNCKQGQIFISGKGQRIYSNAKKQHKESLETGNVNLWDIKLLVKILQQVNFATDRQHENKRIDAHILNQILELRREIVRIPNCWIENENFNNLWDRMCELMMQLGDSPEALRSLKFNDSIANNDRCDDDVDIVNVLRANGFKEVANAFYKDGKFTEAIESYSEGIYLDGLSKNDLGALYSNRGFVYMAAAETNLFPQSLLLSKHDAKRALELRPTWFRAYYRLACLFREAKKYQKAIKYFDIALILDPKHSETSEEQVICRKKLHEEKFSDAIYPEKLPKNDAEMAEEISRQFGTRMSAEFFLAMEERLKKLQDARPLVWQAHRRIAGYNAEQNYQRAAELYQKASQQGNAEALYSLAILHRDGKGVKKDVKLSLKLLRQAASKPRIYNGTRNVGVAEAEFALGCAYEKGLGVCEDLTQAFSWYTKASEHGNKHAANTLACFYFHGKEVRKSEANAVEFWKLAALRRNVIAMQSLADYYLENERDAEKALHWHHKAVESGNLIAKSITKEFETRVNNIKAETMEIEQSSDHTESIIDEKESVNKFISKVKEISDPACKQMIPFDKDILETFASNGSETATLLQEALTHFTKANSLLQYKTAFSSVIIPELANCIRICEKVITWNNETKNEVMELVLKAFQLVPKDELTEIDRDARICYLTLQEMPIEQTLSFLDECISKYPDEVWFYIVLCNLLGVTKENEKGVNETFKALKLFPNNCDLLFVRASHLQALKPSNGNIIRNSQEIIAAYEQFLTSVASDHRKVPQAYYSIALEYLLSSNKNTPEERNMRMIIKYYKLGLMAERGQLPFYMPYVCDKKVYLQAIPYLNSLVATEEQQNKIQNSVVVCLSKNVEEKQECLCMNKLLDSKRVNLIKEHREIIAQVRGAIEDGPMMNKMHCLYFQRKVVSEELQKITLKNMDASKGIVYEGFVISLVVIEEPFFGFSGIHVIVEDENGDAERLCVYNFPQGEAVRSKLGFGCAINVLNPYYKIGSDGKGLLQVDDLCSIIFESGPNFYRCKFCGKAKSALKCGRCMKTVYCSRDCQLNDWRLLRHKLVCTAKE